jgi:hypothetical protein
MRDTLATVLQEILDGQGVGLAAVARKLPNSRADGAGHVNPSTLFRWCTAGCKGANGQIIRLEHVRAGSRILTTWPTVERFLSSLTAPPDTAPALRTPTQQRRETEEAVRELVHAGC